MTIMGSSQWGKTLMLQAIMGYYIDVDPAPMMLVEPTLEMATSFSKDRLAPMVRDTVCLRDKVYSVKSRSGSNTMLHKSFPKGHLTMSGANSPSSLASRPIRILFLDEPDRYPISAGTEGDPTALASKRTQTFWNRKIIATSSPTIKGASRIESLFAESSQDYFYVRCLACKHAQTLIWGQVKWDSENVTNVWYECSNCQAKLTEKDKYIMLANGYWQSTHPEKIRHRGFFISELYSPWSSWERMVSNFLEAKKQRETLRVFINTSLAETFVEEESIEFDSTGLLSRTEDYIDVPQGAMVLTAGIDVQDDRIEFLVKGWGLKEESWFVAYKIFYGSPAMPETWKMVNDYFATDFKHESGIVLRIASACVDTGGHFTHNVYQYVKSKKNSRIFATKGMGGSGRPIIGKPSRNNKLRVSLFPLGVDTAKELIFDRLRIDEFGGGYMHFNRACTQEYFDQLTAEKRIVKYNKGFSTRIWVKKRARNEALDCEVMALASFYLLNANMELIAEGFKPKEEEKKFEPLRETPKQINKPFKPFKQNFATSWK